MTTSSKERRLASRRASSKRYRDKYPDRVKASKARYLLQNSEKSLARSQAWRKTNRNYLYFKSLEKRLGITKNQYEQLYKKAKNKCQICKKVNLRKRDRRLMVDHNHKTNKPRGILCSNCNVGLGYFKDAKHLLKNALSYIGEYE